MKRLRFHFTNKYIYISNIVEHYIRRTGLFKMLAEGVKKLKARIIKDNPA